MERYKQRKQNNLITVEKVEGGELTIRKKQFDVNTGEEVDSVPDRYLKSTLLANKAELEAKLEDINEMLKEFSRKEV